MTSLSNEQKSSLCQLAREAYDAWPGRGAFEECNPELSRSKCFEAWRRVEQGKAVGQQSLRDCVQEQFLPLRAHFKALLQDGRGAMGDLMRHAEEPRLVARYKLQEALRQRGLDESYVATICRRQFKCALGEASAKQLWNLVFTIRNRRKPLATARAPRRTFVAVKAGTLSVEEGNPF